MKITISDGAIARYELRNATARQIVSVMKVVSELELEHEEPLFEDDSLNLVVTTRVPSKAEIFESRFQEFIQPKA